ncbi:MAG: serine--tRNA ligase, partial [Phascolarctobacterium sp.]|nr:serine--tRNA ligase [Phascolarctobacterium sp.]
MLDMKFVRENPELVMEAVKKRNGNLDLTEFLELDKKRREITVQVETLKSERNTASQEIGKLKKAGQDATEQMAAVRALGDKIAEDDKELKEIEARLKEILLTIPNIPADDVPVGADDSANPVVRTWGEPGKFEFEPKAHWDIGEGLNIIDFERGVKVSGARYIFYRGLG